MALKLPIYNFFIDETIIEYDIKNGTENTLIIIHNNENDFITSDFFSKILQSVNLNLAKNCSLLKIDESDKISISQIINTLKYNKVLFIGLEPQDVGLSIQINHFKILEIDKKKLIQLPGLSQISNSIDLKKKLWEVLKELYK